MTKRLYVGNIAWSTTNDSLRDFFTQVGPVLSAEVVINKFDGRSKGFGFVEMETEEAAQAAIEQLNKRDLDGRMIFVNEARPPVARSGGHRGGRGGYNGGSGGYHHPSQNNDQGGYGGDHGAY